MGSTLGMLVNVVSFPLQLLWKITREWLKGHERNLVNIQKDKSFVLRIRQFVVFLYLSLRQRFLKRRLVDITTDYSKGAIKFGVIPSEEERNLENPRQLKNVYDFDEIFFCGFNSGGDSIILRMTRRGSNEAGVQFYLKYAATNDIYQLPFHPETNVLYRERDGFSAAGFRIRCLNPIRNWRISYNGLLRKITPAGDRVQEDVHVKFSFIWAVTSLPFDFKIDFCPRLLSQDLANCTWNRGFPTYERITKIQDRYDQWGQWRGTVHFEDQEDKEMLLWGMKSRQSGSIDRTIYGRYIHLYGWMKDGMTFNISLVPLSSFCTHLRCGYIVHPNHNVYPLQGCDLTLPSTGQLWSEWTITCLAGDKLYKISITLGEESFRSFVGSQWEHREYTRLANFSIQDELGKGVVMYGERNEIPRPIKETEKIEHVFNLDIGEKGDVVIPQVLEINDSWCMSSTVAGGKGMSVSCLMKLSTETGQFYVPNGIVLSTAAYRRHLAEHPQLERALNTVRKAASLQSTESLKKACSRAFEEFSQTSLSEELKDEVASMLKKVFSQDVSELRFAVRSSAVGEDSSDTSAAGQMETTLGVKGLAEIHTAIERSWASSVTFTAVQYRKQNGQSVEADMAVVIQEMVPSEVAGVMFTVHPVTGHPSYISVSANFGLGESVVSAASEPDTYTLRKFGEADVILHDRILGKKGTIFKMTESGTKKEATTKTVSSEWCLSKEKVETLGKLGILVELAFGSSRDIEWAISNNNFFLLQARPVTTEDKFTDYELVHGLDTGLPTENEYLSIANLGEVMPGATSPLCLTTTYITLRSAFMLHLHHRRGSWHPFIPLFCSDHIMSHNHSMFAIEETIMKEVEEEDSLISRAWELSMFGRFLEEREQIRQRVIHRFGYLPKTVKWKTLLYIMVDAICPERSVENVKQKVLNFRLPPEVMKSSKTLYEYLTLHLTDLIEVTLVHDVVSTFSSVMNTLLFGQIIDSYKENIGELLKDMANLISVGKNVESANVPIQIQELATEVYKSGFSDTFEAMESQDALQWLRTDKGTVGIKFRDFVSTHGHRCLKELDSLIKPWNEDPESIVKTLQGMMKTVHHIPTAKQKVSIDEAIDQLKYKPAMFSRLFLRFLVSQARRGVSIREASKSVFVKSVDNFRKGYRLLGKLMVKEGRLPEPDLLHFFTNEEIRELLTTRSSHLLSTAFRRRKLHEKLDAMIFPEIMIGEPKPVIAEECVNVYSSLQELRGVTVCQGVVKGVARVARNLTEASNIQQGDILVAHSTDIGWSPYFPLLSGIVTELGGLISHGAVVAREYGLPSLVAVHGATTILKTGDLVILDATQGVLKKMEERKEE
ncbi:uncharacterized protein LOC106470801 isoform X2 [Limulus polyphemus]|uniref:Uncharacterized protein LOC106470801 isoform X2 n=1 Tax=Limulus polyphemus TaxID=6850 RepID=A0ABM1TJJ8_LIMPO|nr:uncharacterized protein LOC106470801 isoform X2 [Limulus polyphemus]